MIRGIFIILAAALVAACNPVAVIGTADNKIEEFHTHWNSGEIQSVWDQTHPAFRASVEQGRLVTMLTDFRSIFGDMETTERENFNINTNNGVTSITVIMRTQFTNGEALETFIFQESGADLKLLSYNAQTPMLDDYDPTGLQGEGMIYEPPPVQTVDADT